MGIRETDGLVLSQLVAVPDNRRNTGLQDVLRVLCQENIVPELHAGGCAVVGTIEELMVNLDEPVRQHRDEITATMDGDELDRLKAEEKRLVAKKQEAMDKKLQADDAADKRYYADRMAELKADWHCCAGASPASAPKPT